MFFTVLNTPCRASRELASRGESVGCRSGRNLIPGRLSYTSVPRTPPIIFRRPHLSSLPTRRLQGGETESMVAFHLQTACVPPSYQVLDASRARRPSRKRQAVIALSSCHVQCSLLFMGYPTPGSRPDQTSIDKKPTLSPLSGPIYPSAAPPWSSCSFYALSA
jgi:hypothetical protein